MSALPVGPLALPLGAVLLLFAFAAAAVAGRVAGWRSKTGIVSSLADMLIIGVVTARLAFVAQWREIYLGEPRAIVEIGDGGFEPWAGIAAALLVAAWQAWRKAALRVPLAVGIAAGAVAWAGALGAMRALDPPEGRLMPSTPLTTLEGDTTTLATLADGKPAVVNLWATWCPPCVREMPVLAAAQRSHRSVTFVFADQAESPEAIRRFLDHERLDLTNVVIDDGRLARATRSPGLPTTLFYDREGRLVDVHMGALSPASLAAKLSRLGPGATPRR